MHVSTHLFCDMFLIFVRAFHIFSVNKQRMVAAHGVAVPMRRDVIVKLRKSRLSYALAKSWEGSMRVQDLIGVGVDQRCRVSWDKVT